MGELRREVWTGARRLVRAPAFSVAVVATLALGIGGTTAVFGVVYGVLVRPLPYPDPDQLVWIRNVREGIGERDFSFSMADYLALEEQQRSFSDVAAYDPNGVTLTTDEGAERLQAHMVTAGLMPMLGIRPVLGRGILDEDTRPGAEAVAVIGWGLWRSRLGGDPAVVGRTVTLDDAQVTVVGVLPPARGHIEADRDLFLPLVLEPPSRKGPFYLYVVGRLREGSSRTVAAAELAGISERIFPVWRDSFPDREVHWGMWDLKEAILGDAGPSLWVAMIAVAALLLIALANAANLLVARAIEQEREVAVRAALGAGWARLLVHRLSESLVLSALGSGAGLLLALAGLRAAGTLGASFLPRISEVALDAPVIGFLVAVAAVSVTLLALVPALQTRAPLASLRAPGRSVSTGARERRVRQVLVVAQFTVTVPLLVGGALLASSLRSLRAVDPGFDAAHVLSAGLMLPSLGYEETEARRAFWHRVVDEVRALPGVETAGWGNGRPPDDPGFGNNFVLEDRPIPPGESQPAVPWTIAGPSYFDALGVPLLAGRMFDTSTDSARVALVDETWARRFFGEPEAAVGRRFVQGGCTEPGRCPWWTVIGVVGDVEYNGLAQDDEGAMYLDGERFSQRFDFVFVRTATDDPAALVPALRRILRQAEPRAPITDVATGSELLDTSLRADRYLAGLVSIFGAVALTLSLVGIYGVMVYFVGHHRREMGVRLALGGQPRHVAGMVMATAMRLVLAGIFTGSLLALGLSRLLEAVLFQVDPWDPLSFAAVAGTLGVAAAVACWRPALRASRLDPALILREE